MIIYTFLSSQKTLDLNDIVSTIENSFSGLKMNTFIPSPFPSQNQTIEVHGGIAIINNNSNLSIQIIFFDNNDNWNGLTITQNGITLSYIKGVYSNIPSQSEIQKILQNAGYL